HHPEAGGRDIPFPADATRPIPCPHVDGPPLDEARDHHELASRDTHGDGGQAMRGKEETPPPAHGRPEREAPFFCAIRISTGSAAVSLPHAPGQDTFRSRGGPASPPLAAMVW